MKFVKLYKKEMRALAGLALLVIGITLFLDLFLQTRVDKWTPSTPEAASAAFFVVLPVWAVIALVYSVQQEWTGNTIYMLLSLPVRGSVIIAAKLLAVLSWFVVLNLFRLVSFLLHFRSTLLWPESGSPMHLLAFWVGMLAFGYLLGMALFLVLMLFSMLAGRLAPKFCGAAAFGTMFVSGWALFRLTPIISKLFGWLPGTPVKVWGMHSGVLVMETVVLNTAHFVAIALLGAGFFALASMLVERQVEV